MTFIPAANLNEILDDVTATDRARVAQRIVRRAAVNVNTDSGNYAETLQVTADDRGVVAESLDVAGHIIEFGSINNAPQAPLRKAAADEGRFEPK